MKRTNILCAIVFGSMLAITGCGDDGNGGAAGSGGSNGTPSNTCEALCLSTCAYEGIDPDQGYDACLGQCVSAFPDFGNDQCGPQFDAYLSCVEARNCNLQAAECQSALFAWGNCALL